MARPGSAGHRRAASRRRRGQSRRHRAAGGRRSHPQPGPQVVQAEGIGQGQSVAPRLGRLGGVKDLVKDPRRDQQAEDKALVGKADKYREDEHVGQRLDELPVVHGADPGDKAQQPGQHGMGMQGRSRPPEAGLPPLGGGDRRAARQGSQ